MLSNVTSVYIPEKFESNKKLQESSVLEYQAIIL